MGAAKGAGHVQEMAGAGPYPPILAKNGATPGAGDMARLHSDVCLPFCPRRGQSLLYP